MQIDWEAVERSPEFRELVASRRRFVLLAGGLSIGAAAAYVVLAGLAPGALGARVAGPITLWFVAGFGLIVMTWVVTRLYIRRSERVWEPMERRIAERAQLPGEGTGGERPLEGVR
jgi:uncharacterized membrane protein (DUF485 family)